MAIRDVRTIQLTNSLHMTEVEITYPDDPSQDHTTYEVHCSNCEGVDTYDNFERAVRFAPVEHECEPYIGEVD